MTQGPKTHRLSFLFFLFNHILHWLCFKILFTEWKYLVSNWSYTHFIKTIKKVTKSSKKFKIFLVIIVVHNHYFVILKLFLTIKSFILYQLKQTALKSDYNFTSYGKLMDTNWIEELQTRNLSLLFGPLAQYLGSDKQRILSGSRTKW